MRSAAGWKTAFAIALLTALPGRGGQLPGRRYTTAEGLANNTVYHILSDPHGFLWFATGEGLSRFDGYGFSNLTTRDGLPHRSVTQVLIDRRGTYWLATPAGLVRYRPDRQGAGRLLVMRPNGADGSEHITSLFEDRNGTIWCGTYAGVFTVDSSAVRPELRPVDIGLQPNSPEWGRSVVEAIAQDPQDAIWIATFDGALYRRTPDGRVGRYLLGRFEVTNLLSDRHGQLWIGTERGLYRMAQDPRTRAFVFNPLFGKNGVPQARVHTLMESRDGSIWVGMYEALARFPEDEGPVRVWNGNSGLAQKSVMAVGEDRDGNLWLGTDDLGAWKLPAEDFLTYSTADGLGSDVVIAIGATVRGELFVTARIDHSVFVNVREAERFRALRPRVPKNINYYGWRPGQIVLQDHTGEWWLASNAGLCRYPRLAAIDQIARTLPLHVYTTRDGLPSDDVIRIYEDRRGNLWVGSDVSGWFGYWSRSTDKFVRVPAASAARASAFGEDSAGHVWIGDESGQLWRVEEARAMAVGGSRIGRGWIDGFVSDHAGRLWIATSSGGLLRIDQPSAPNPEVRVYGRAEGLSSVSIRCVTEDGNGSIYLGNGGGVDQLDPDTGHVRHYTAADGLAPGRIHAAYRDQSGVIWFGGNRGLTRMNPKNNRARNPPATWITALSIGGHPNSIPESGTQRLHGIEVPPGQDQIQFDFVGLSYAPGEVLSYQHRLGDDPWSAPTQTRSLNYGALAHGKYRFEVRAINSDGEPSPSPALVEFHIIAPVWRRPWFDFLVLATAVAAAMAVHRARVQRLLEMERVRMRIATDLHDDLGSSLSQIAILSDVARGRAAHGEGSEPVERIGHLSRDLLESMSDIVWAIQPLRDRFSDLKHRMHRFAADVLSTRNIEMHWDVESAERDLDLDAELRRQVYLVFKESINNIARHSGATTAYVRLRLTGCQLMLEVSDNGCGVERWDGPDGNGLRSMKMRAAGLGGTLEVRSAGGQGTTIVLHAPLPVQVVRRWRFMGRVGK